MNRAQSVTRELMDDIWTQTGLTPSIISGAWGTFLIVCDNHHGQYLISNRNSGLPDGSSLMLVHSQVALGGENSLLLDLVGLDGTPRTLAQTSALVCEEIQAMQRVLVRLSTEAS